MTTPVRSAQAASGRAPTNCGARIETRGQTRRPHGQPAIAPQVAPKLLVIRSITEVVRRGANNWVNSTEPLRSAPVHIPANTVRMNPALTRAIHKASRNPQGTNKATFPCTSCHEPPESGRAQSRLMRSRMSSPDAEKLNGSKVA